ncbi:MAG TPA: hypothetical protein PLR99_11680 [Polyangiaceae bacterium]|nr:hypothetical protein [Polyangiaceae bacterium]
MRALLRLACLAAMTTLAACSAETTGTDAENGADDLTGTTATERGIHFQSYVYLRDGATDDEIRVAIARQVRTAIGALREPKVALNDRGARSNLDPAKWTRRTLDVVDPSNPAAAPQKVLRVTFPYDDRAVVTNKLARSSSLGITMLADDYGPHADALKQECSDDKKTDTDSLWYHFQPQSAACKARIAKEQAAVDAETRLLGRREGVVGAKEVGRWFVPVVAKLDAPKTPDKDYSPEYDRLFGLAQDKGQLVVYAFLGVDAEVSDPNDSLAKEGAKFLRTMLRAQPNFRPTKTEPYAALLDLFVDGKKLEGVTYDKLLGWIIDDTPMPAEVGADAGKKLALRKQALEKLTERWIYWDLPITVKSAAGEKNVTVQVRSYYGYEDGSAEARQHAQWRYLEAMWHGDVFLYNGHSHFGHGPLEPTLYGPQNFNDRYQIMMVNSCVSFNYYHEDFLEKKPGGSKNLDMVVNGLPSWVYDGGVAMGRLLTGLLDGKQRSYRELLESMRLDMPWGERGYDPMRVVDGELDNEFSQARTPLTVTVRPPVY